MFAGICGLTGVLLCGDVWPFPFYGISFFLHFWQAVFAGLNVDSI